MRFNPLTNPACLAKPEYLSLTAWAGHIPFAMFIMDALRPRVFVELGTYRGASYCAFCQSAKQGETKCFAIDTWQGDLHAGKLEDGIFEALSNYHDPLYGDFSRLVRSTFDEALTEFEDGSIGLLHIDGFHSYEAVRHDFESWLPKMEKDGIVLFHDTAVKSADFGVWKFWQELLEKYPGFEFHHSHGLGVLSLSEKPPAPLEFLFSADQKQAEDIRNLFEALGFRIEGAERIRVYEEQVAALQKYEDIVKASFLRKIYRFLKGI